jgi:hypothetical protein
MYRVMSFIGAIAAIIFLLFFGIALTQHPPKGTQDFAAWAQAIGSIGAILVAVWVYYSQHLASIRRAKNDEHQEIRSILSSLRDEMQVITETFVAGTGGKLSGSAQGTPFLRKVALFGNPFFIYEGYKGQIGKIPDDELRKLIITGYGRAFGMMNSLILNNNLIERYEQADYLVAIGKDEAYHGNAKRALSVVTEYGDTLREYYKETSVITDKLIAALNQAVANSHYP